MYKLIPFISCVSAFLTPSPYISSGRLVNEIRDKKITDLQFSDDLSKVVSVDTDGDYHVTRISTIVVDDLFGEALKYGVDTHFDPLKVDNQFTIPIVLFSVYLLVNLFQSFMFNRGGGVFGNMNLNNIEIEQATQSNITLSDWAGSPEIKLECAEIVTYLKNNTNYINANAKIPRGILLEGPPGTGKTLLAKAIAGECNANFLSVSASEFVEIFVGVGASRVRQLFKQARKQAPTIIFIDEIDAIGKKRSVGLNAGNDEREQTLNQLLSEMDGFKENDNVIVIAATNRKDILDPALLRPGRFDRTVNVPLPDTLSRLQILILACKSKRLSRDVNLESLAYDTSGLSGAQLTNLVNEAAILVARRGETLITQEDFRDALEKLFVGIIKQFDNRSRDVLRRVAIHELGHAFAVKEYPKYFTLQKVSIKATYSGAGGVTIFKENNEIVESGLYTKDFLFRRLVVSLSGKAAENIYYGEENVSIGAIKDLEQANDLARKMIGLFGMGGKLEVFQENREIMYSDNTLTSLDSEVYELIKKAYDEAKMIVQKNYDGIQTNVNHLIDNKTLELLL